MTSIDHLVEAVELLILVASEKPKIVVLTSAELAKQAKLYAKDRYDTTAVKTVSSWADLQQKLKPFKEIGRLVIVSHGEAGQINLELGPGGHLSIGSLTLTPGLTLPLIREIELAGCNVAKAPVDLARFARLMRKTPSDKPPITEAYDSFWVSKAVTLPQGTSAANLKASTEWKTYNGFWMNPDLEAADVVKKTKRTYGAEWFHSSGLTALPMAGDMARGTKFVPRSQAEETRLQNDADVQELKTIYQAFDTDPSGPTLPTGKLRKVIVDLPADD